MVIPFLHPTIDSTIDSWTPPDISLISPYIPTVCALIFLFIREINIGWWQRHCAEIFKITTGPWEAQLRMAARPRKVRGRRYILRGSSQGPGIVSWWWLLLLSLLLSLSSWYVLYNTCIYTYIYNITIIIIISIYIQNEMPLVPWFSGWRIQRASKPNGDHIRPERRLWSQMVTRDTPQTLSTC